MQYYISILNNSATIPPKKFFKLLSLEILDKDKRACDTGKCETGFLKWNWNGSHKIWPSSEYKHPHHKAEKKNIEKFYNSLKVIDIMEDQIAKVEKNKIMK